MEEEEEIKETKEETKEEMEEEMEEEKIKMDEMDLHDILLDIIKIDVMQYNEIHNISYFKTRLENDPKTDDLKNAAMSLLDDLSEQMEFKIIGEPIEDEQIENLNLLVSLCEEIIGI